MEQGHGVGGEQRKAIWGRSQLVCNLQCGVVVVAVFSRAGSERLKSCAMGKLAQVSPAWRCRGSGRSTCTSQRCSESYARREVHEAECSEEGTYTSFPQHVSFKVSHTNPKRACK